MMKFIAQAQMGIVALAVLFAAGLIPTPAIAAQEQTVNAFAAYQAEGKVYITDENSGTFVGAIAGDIFLESKKGPIRAGRIICPVMMLLNLNTGKQAGSGQCVIRANDGAQIFAVWSCRGVHLVGCNGKMILTGGTGRTAGASGSGSMIVRSTSRALIKRSSDKDKVIEFGSGVMALRNFKYKLAPK